MQHGHKTPIKLVHPVQFLNFVELWLRLVNRTSEQQGWVAQLGGCYLNFTAISITIDWDLNCCAIYQQEDTLFMSEFDGMDVTETLYCFLCKTCKI